ncbi:MAG: Hsp20/alpha crystallin family protein [Chloroflexi bacterium]|nr:Hsp20/alpha crystallin family protein [Anaerolineaceae bacterium]NMB90584.1 Hsp20/alpha crystallin family protein [Chloroflexota bacterium]
MVTIKLKPNPMHPTYYIPAAIFFSSPDASTRLNPRPNIWRPPTDVFETVERIVIRVEIAGMVKQEFSIRLDNRLLSISGMRSDSTERRSYYQLEIPFGEFYTEVEIPQPFDSEQVEAEYEDGFLWVYLAKVLPKKININKDKS